MTASPSPETEDRITELLSKMTMKEKLMLLTSHGRRRMYSTKPINRLGIPSFKVTDGPLGAACHSSGFRKNTRFPATISLAATWNRRLAYEVGVAMGKEVRALGRHMLLAPGMNIDRTPLNGRTFEYYSEDPFLTKELAIPFVKGVQSQRVGACVKHYAANNQETDRRNSSSEVDERTLHEIYLRSFRAVVREADPWGVMSCYNMVNGTYGAENRYLLREVLMDKWGFSGFVMTDWFATRNIKTTEGCINAGLSLEMPWPSKYKLKSLERAFNEGLFTAETLEDLVRRYTRVMFLAGAFDHPDSLPQGARNTREHQELAQRSGEEGMVLLKNEGGLLPLDVKSIDSVALLGPNLKKKYGRFLSGGSSAVVPPYEITPLDGMREKCKDTIGIVSDVSQADIAIVFVGLDHGRGKDSESSDRKSLNLPERQVETIKQTASANRNTVVVIMAGSPIAMSEWLDSVPAVLLAWYPGMEGGKAIAKVLFGDVNPSGKLPLTFPRVLSDSPAHGSGTPRTFPGVDKKVYYEEGVFVGYRWFDEKGIDPLFPFGFGQSYTSFQYGDAHLSTDSLKSPEDAMQIEVRVANVGEHPGAEVVQVYSHDVDSSVPRPPKELVGFEKVQIGPSEEKDVIVSVSAQDLAFYDISQHDWLIEPGAFELLVGRSSQEIETRMEFMYG